MRIRNFLRHFTFHGLVVILLFNVLILDIEASQDLSTKDERHGFSMYQSSQKFSRLNPFKAIYHINDNLLGNNLLSDQFSIFNIQDNSETFSKNFSPAVTGSVTPANRTVGVTPVSIVGTATPNATVRCTETGPDGAVNIYNTTANSSGNYTFGPFIIPQLGTYSCVLRDMANGQQITLNYSGSGDFSATVNTTSRTVTAGQSASYTVTFTSVSGFTGVITPIAQNWSNVPNSMASWSPTTVTVPSGGSVQTTFTIQTSSNTPPGTYGNIILFGRNGSFNRSTPTVSLTVNSPTITLTGSVTPPSRTVGVTPVSIVGTATPNATVRCTETGPDGAVNIYNTTANSSGNYTFGPFIIPLLGSYSCLLRDMSSGQEITLNYSGSGNFSASVTPTSRTITAGQPASYTVTFTSVSGFTGVVTLIAQNWSNVPNSTASWSPTSVTVPSNGAVQATFTIQTAANTTPGTYSNILLQGRNGSVTQSASPVSLIVNPPTTTLTGSVTPPNRTVGLTPVSIVGTATPNAIVRCTETAPDGAVNIYNTNANSSGNYTFGPFIIPQLGTYNCVLRDMSNGQEIQLPYSGSGDFTASVTPTSRTIAAGQSANYTVTFTSVAGFSGIIDPAAINWGQIPGATAHWSPIPVTVPSNGSIQTTFTIQTDAGTPNGTYSSITLQGRNGSIAHATSPVSLVVNGSSGGSQPQLKAPWEGRAQISQGNRGSVSHNVCNQRSYDRRNCNWENTYAIDVAIRSGTEVLAPAAGRISFVKNTLSGAGREVGLEVTGPTGQKFTIMFLHLSKILVGFNTNVVQGQPIAKSGASGGGKEVAFGAHLHFHMWSGSGSPDSHTQPMERLVLGSTSSNFREYNGANGELNNSVIGNYRWWHSNNVRTAAFQDVSENIDVSEQIAPQVLNGNHDQANCSSISGWAWDSNLPMSPIEVDIYDGNLLINTTTADEFRPDLLSAGIGNGFHGFNLPTPAFLKDGLTHTIRVRYSGTNTEIPNSGRSFTCSGSPNPTPQYEGYFDEANCRKFFGWAWNHNLLDDPISVDVYDGANLIATVSANQYREDLETASIGNGFHSFNFIPPNSLKDGQTHTIHFKYGGTNIELNGSPKQFNSNACGSVICPTSVGQGVNGLELEAFRNAFSDAGGQSVLGCPTAVVRFDGFTSFNGTTSHYQTFANGDIEYHVNGANAGQGFAIINPLYTRWAQLGFNTNNPQGYPIGFRSPQESSCYGTNLRYQEFEGGSLEQHLSGPLSGQVFEVHGPIFRKWGIKGYAACPQGEPISEEYVAPFSGATSRTGRAVNFEGGRIYRINIISEAFEVHGAILNLYMSMGTSGSWLGFPISDEYVANTGYARSDFEGGYITTLNGTNYQAFPYTTPHRSPVDFDGDGMSDVSIFRPSNAQWWINRSSTGQTVAAQFGESVDKITPGDFTGDGKTDIAFWRPSTGQWFILRSEDASFYAFPFGANGDIPMPADYDGDGKTDPAVFRPSNAVWYILRSSDGGVTIQQFGAGGDKPIAADYDGDGKADIAIIRRGAGVLEWWFQRSSNGQVTALQFGESNDKAAPGDYTGDGKTDIAFFRPSNGFWYILRSEDSSFYGFPFGTNNDIPAPGDYDGDGKFDPAVFRPSNSTWYIYRSASGVLIQVFGVTGDIPVPTAYTP